MSRQGRRCSYLYAVRAIYHVPFLKGKNIFPLMRSLHLQLVGLDNPYPRISIASLLTILFHLFLLIYIKYKRKKQETNNIFYKILQNLITRIRMGTY